MNKAPQLDRQVKIGILTDQTSELVNLNFTNVFSKSYRYLVEEQRFGSGNEGTGQRK